MFTSRKAPRLSPTRGLLTAAARATHARSASEFAVPQTVPRARPGLSPGAAGTQAEPGRSRGRTGFNSALSSEATPSLVRCLSHQMTKEQAQNTTVLSYGLNPHCSSC